jgi:transposase
MMDTSAELVQPPIRPRKQHRSTAEKRRIVEETLVEGASVARVARANGVNANQVFHWRKLYQAGRLGAKPKAVALLPVTIADAPDSVSGTASATVSAAAHETGTIHIKIGAAQIRVEGRVDGGLLRLVLESLRG